MTSISLVFINFSSLNFVRGANDSGIHVGFEGYLVFLVGVHFWEY